MTIGIRAAAGPPSALRTPWPPQSKGGSAAVLSFRTLDEQIAAS